MRTFATILVVAITSVHAGSALAVAADVPRPVIRAIPILIDPPTLAALARVNPMAALALSRFTAEHHLPSLNLLRGRIDYPGIPSLQTFAPALQRGVPDDQIWLSFAAKQQAENFGQTRWQASRDSAGTSIRVRFDAVELDPAEALVRAVYPPVEVTISGLPSPRLSAWRVVADR